MAPAGPGRPARGPGEARAPGIDRQGGGDARRKPPLAGVAFSLKRPAEEDSPAPAQLAAGAHTEAGKRLVRADNET